MTLPENVEKALKLIYDHGSEYEELRESADALRAHIEVQAAKNNQLTQMVCGLTETHEKQSAEIGRLRGAATNLLDKMHGLTQLQEVQRRAPTWAGYIGKAVSGLQAALAPTK